MLLPAPKSGEWGRGLGSSWTLPAVPLPRRFLGATEGVRGTASNRELAEASWRLFLSASGSKVDATVGGQGIGASSSPPFLWWRLRSPAWAWAPSPGVGVGVPTVLKLHFYLT